jgi:hypothetical protein
VVYMIQYLFIYEGLLPQQYGRLLPRRVVVCVIFLIFVPKNVYITKKCHNYLNKKQPQCGGAIGDFLHCYHRVLMIIVKGGITFVFN